MRSTGSNLEKCRGCVQTIIFFQLKLNAGLHPRTNLDFDLFLATNCSRFFIQFRIGTQFGPEQTLLDPKLYFRRPLQMTGHTVQNLVNNSFLSHIEARRVIMASQSCQESKSFREKAPQKHGIKKNFFSSKKIYSLSFEADL